MRDEDKKEKKDMNVKIVHNEIKSTNNGHKHIVPKHLEFRRYRPLLAGHLQKYIKQDGTYIKTKI